MADLSTQREVTFYLVTGLDGGDPFSHRLHDAARLVAKDGGEHALGVLANTDSERSTHATKVQNEAAAQKTRQNDEKREQNK